MYHHHFVIIKIISSSSSIVVTLVIVATAHLTNQKEMLATNSFCCKSVNPLYPIISKHESVLLSLHALIIIANSCWVYWKKLSSGNLNAFTFVCLQRQIHHMSINMRLLLWGLGIVSYTNTCWPLATICSKGTMSLTTIYQLFMPLAMISNNELLNQRKNAKTERTKWENKQINKWDFRLLRLGLCRNQS